MPWCHSVGFNNITGDAADHLANVVLEHAIMTDFCEIPLVALRENSITELNLEHKGVGEPGAIVLSKLLPSAAALTSLKCACRPKAAFAFVSAPVDTPHHQPHSSARSLQGTSLGPKGGAAIAEGLKGNSTLQSLKFAAHLSNRLPSVRLLVSAHWHGSPPTSKPHPRSLKYNQLGSKAGSAIAEGLKGNSTLQSLK